MNRSTWKIAWRWARATHKYTLGHLSPEHYCKLPSPLLIAWNRRCRRDFDDEFSYSLECRKIVNDILDEILS